MRVIFFGTHCIFSQFLQSVIEQRVEVAEQNQRNFGLPTDILSQLEDFAKRYAVAERPIRCPLNDRAVRDGIRERHAELDQIRSGLIQGENQLKRSLEARIAGRDVGYKRLLPLGFQLREFFLNTCHFQSISAA